MRDKKHMNKEIYNVLSRKIEKLTKKELLSTISYLRWEQEFLSSLKDESNQRFVEELEAKRISDTLFADSQQNYLVTLMLTFETAVSILYENDIRIFLSCTCKKFKNLTYKVVPFLFRGYIWLKCWYSWKTWTK